MNYEALPICVVSQVYILSYIPGYIISTFFLIFLSLHILETNFSVQVKTVRYYCEILRAYFYFYDFKMLLYQNKLLSCIFFIPFNHYFYANRHCLEPFNHKMQ